MNSNDFLSEGIVEDAHEMHQDHEVQMAREECYHAAGDAIALHKLLKHVSEQQGLEGWVSAKVTLAADYLKTVREYLEYQLMTAQSQQNGAAQTVLPVAEGVITADDFKTITEVDPHNFDSDEDYYNALKAKPKAHHAPVSRPRSHPEDTDYFDPVERRLRADQERVRKANAEYYAKKGVAEAGEWTKLPNGNWRNMHTGVQQSTPPKTKKPRRTMGLHASLEQHADDKMKELGHKFKPVDEARVGNRMSDIEIGSPKIVHYKGKAVGEVGLDHEASPGNGPFYMKHYLTGKDMVGYDTKKEALADLKHMVMQHEGLAENAGSIATVVNPTPKNKAKVGTLFGGTYQRESKAKKAK